MLYFIICMCMFVEQFTRFIHLSSSLYRNQPTPIAVSALSNKNVVYLSAGGNHCAAVTEDGELYTWGRGSYGRLGHGMLVVW